MDPGLNSPLCQFAIITSVLPHQISIGVKSLQVFTARAGRTKGKPQGREQNRGEDSRMKLTNHSPRTHLSDKAAPGLKELLGAFSRREHPGFRSRHNPEEDQV